MLLKILSPEYTVLSSDLMCNTGWCVHTEVFEQEEAIFPHYNTTFLPVMILYYVLQQL